MGTDGRGRPARELGPGQPGRGGAVTVRCGPRRSIAGKQAGIVGDGKGQGAAGGGVPTTSSTPGALPGKVEDSGACLGGGVEQGRVWGSGRNGGEPRFSGSLSGTPA